MLGARLKGARRLRSGYRQVARESGDEGLGTEAIGRVDAGRDEGATSRAMDGVVCGDAGAGRGR